MSFYRDQLENWLKTIDVKAERVLDVGGGANPVGSRTRSWNVKEYKVLDNELEKMVWKPDYIMDLNERIVFSFEGEPRNFDMIFCLEIFEYIWNPVQAMENLNMMIREGGTLYASFPMIYPIHSPHKDDYLRYTRFGIIKLMGKFGFKIEKIIGREARDPEKLIDFYKSDGMHIKADSTITGYLVKAIKI